MTAVAIALVGPNALPMKVMNEPVEGCARENCARVLARKPMATPAAMIVSGEAMPAVRARNPNPK